ANHVIHLDRWWNPAVENQATDRAFRIGQTRNVQVRKFVCAGTLEEKIDEMIEEKKALADLVITDGEGWLTELSTGELRKVFELSGDAVGEERVSAAVAPAARLRRAEGPQHPRRDRPDLVVRAVRRGPGGHGPRQPAATGPELRAPRPGDLPRRGRGNGDGAGAGQPRAALPGAHRHH